MIDIISYVMGSKGGSGTVIIDGSSYTFTDASNDGNIVITKTEE